MRFRVPLLNGFASVREIVCRIDQCDMRKGLRKVSEHPSRTRIVLFRQEAHIVAQRQQIFEKLSRLIPAPKQNKVVSVPEAAGQEHAFAASDAVNCCARIVAADQAARRKLFPDGLDGRCDSWIAGRQEADQRHEKSRGIECARAVALDKSADLRSEPLPANLPVNLPPDVSPALDWPFKLKASGHFDSAIKGHPRHHLRGGEM